MWERTPTAVTEDPWVFTVENKPQATNFVQAASKLVEKADVKNLMKELESAIATQGD